MILLAIALQAASPQPVIPAVITNVLPSQCIGLGLGEGVSDCMGYCQEAEKNVADFPKRLCFDTIYEDSYIELPPEVANLPLRKYRYGSNEVLAMLTPGSKAHHWWDVRGAWLSNLTDYDFREFKKRNGRKMVTLQDYAIHKYQSAMSVRTMPRCDELCELRGAVYELERLGNKAP